MWVRGYVIRDRGYRGDVFIEERHQHYGFFSFLFDVFMLIITCGWWLLWIIIREWRRR